MYCVKCGAELPEDANYCSKCGHCVNNMQISPNTEQTRKLLDKANQSIKVNNLLAGIWATALLFFVSAITFSPLTGLVVTVGTWAFFLVLRHFIRYKKLKRQAELEQAATKVILNQSSADRVAK